MLHFSACRAILQARGRNGDDSPVGIVRRGLQSSSTSCRAVEMGMTAR